MCSMVIFVNNYFGIFELWFVFFDYVDVFGVLLDVEIDFLYFLIFQEDGVLDICYDGVSYGVV